MLKGYHKLNKAITKQLKPFGISRAVGADDYAYYYQSEMVTYRLTLHDCDEAYSDFIYERFGYEDTDVFIISLLHEVGHHMTDDDITQNVYDFCIKEKERIAEEIQHAHGADWTKLQYEYFQLPDEIMATAWAIDYAKKHPKKVRKMWKKCEKALHEFYDKNLGDY